MSTPLALGMLIRESISGPKVIQIVGFTAGALFRSPVPLKCDHTLSILKHSACVMVAASHANPARGKSRLGAHFTTSTGAGTSFGSWLCIGLFADDIF